MTATAFLWLALLIALSPFLAMFGLLLAIGLCCACRGLLPRKRPNPYAGGKAP